MAGRLRGVRIGLVTVALLLLLVLSGYIFYAHKKAQAEAFLHDLPKKLGMDITQSTDNFTFSQSLKGKTVFTIHASKELQHKNGVITLHEVSILLYGATGTRHDRIQGQEFEYDQKNGILRAVGEALIDLAPPGDKVYDEAQMIHVKTSGLVFRKDDGTAETQEAIEFMQRGLSGQAVGASYNSKTSALVLQSQVKLSGQRGGRPFVLTANRAELDRPQQVILLDSPKYVSSGESGAQSVSSATAVVHTNADGNPLDVQARGYVELAGGGRGTVSAERMDMTLKEDGQPREGHLYGRVTFVDDTVKRQERGRAQDVRVAFDEGRARHATMTGSVQLDQTTSVGSRRLEADKLELALGGGGKEKLVLRGAVAGGSNGATLRIADKTAKGTSATVVRAATLTGRFGAVGLTGLDGVGKTSLERVETNPAGQRIAKETSTGDTLAIDLKPAAKGRMQLAHAVQRGGVEIVREAAAKKAGAPPEVEHAQAASGDYDADRDELTLAGGAQVSDAASAVYADRVQLERGTGDALAEGAVRVSYAQGKPGSEPLHVLAQRALVHKSTGTAQFSVGPGSKVRMWQGGSQVEAPLVDFDRLKKVLVAHGSGEPDAVHTTLAAAAAKPGAKADAPVNVLSEKMTYTDALRQVDFAGHVQVKEAAGSLRAQEAVVYLAPAAAKVDPVAGLFGGGKVDRIVGSGGVLLEQPGRKATGDKIVYTAADDTYVLTGTRAVPPRLDDQARGAVTGAQLRFKRGEEAVEVVGGEGGRVRSEPRARQ